MKAIAGLGNPGQAYADTPHNAGFRALAEIARITAGRFRFRLRFQAELSLVKFRGQDVALIQPATFMNNSGAAVGGVLAYYGIPSADLVVIVDDADLEVGTLRIRPGGGSGGHKGLQSIMQVLGGDAFPRVRIGIGRGGRAPNDLVRHVLQPIAEADRPAWQAAVDGAAQAALCIVERGLDEAMNRFNTRRKPPEDQEQG